MWRLGALLAAWSHGSTPLSDRFCLTGLAGGGTFEDKCGDVHRGAPRGPSVQAIAAGPFPVGGPGYSST